MDLFVRPVEGKLGVAVSGGADSMALLDAYLSVGQDLVVLNVEHGIRGEASLRDTVFVSSYCKERGVPFLTRSVSVPTERRQGESEELCARRLRYAFFDELLARRTVDAIALAHHADDDAETLLLRLFRGTGIRGLVGIADRDGYIHPLLSYRKEEILAYVRERNLPYVTDETNASSEYTRNFIRNEVLPLVKTRYPDCVDALTRLSACASEADEYLSSVAPVAEETDGRFYLESLFGYPIVLQKYAILNTAKRLGVERDFEARHVDVVLSLVGKANNTTMDLPFSLRAARFEDGVILWKKREEIFAPVPFDEGATYRFFGRTYRFAEGEGIVSGATFDGDAIPDGTVVRTRRDGDVFKRVNGKTKLLSDYLNDRKLSAPEKEGLLVAAIGQTVLLVFGLETADAVKITEKTKRILRVVKE